MPSVSLTLATYAYGGPYETPQWQTDMPSFDLANYGTLAFVRFSGAAELMDLTQQNALITAATLTISGIGSPPTTETLSARLNITSGDYPDPVLPIDLSDAFDTEIGDPAWESAENQPVVTLDVRMLLITALGDYIADGDAIMFRIENTTYSGSGLGGMTATLDVTWDVLTPDGVTVTAGDIEVTLAVEAAQGQPANDVVVTSGDVDLTLSVESSNALVAHIVTATDVANNLSVEATSVLVPRIVTAADIGLTAAIEPVSTEVVVTAGDIDLTLSVEATSALVAHIVTAGDIAATLSIESTFALVAHVVTAADIDLTASVQSVRRVAGWRTATPSNITLTVAGAS